jgi:TrmH family RNA methyltransferase
MNPTSPGSPRSAVDSPKNPRVAFAVQAFRDGARMPLEGARTLGEALDAGVRVETLFYEEGAVDEALLSRVEERGASLHPSSRRVVERLSDLAASRGVVAVASLPESGLDLLGSLPHGRGAWLLLDGLQDPSNVGAVIRSAEAFGSAGALLTSGCASPYSARALRASAGSTFRLPLAVGVEPSGAVAWFRDRGIVLAGGVARGGEDTAGLRSKAPSPVALAVGSEGRGLSSEVESALGLRLTLPMEGRVESLNAAVAASLLLYLLSEDVRLESVDLGRRRTRAPGVGRETGLQARLGEE